MLCVYSESIIILGNLISFIWISFLQNVLVRRD